MASVTPLPMDDEDESLALVGTAEYLSSDGKENELIAGGHAVAMVEPGTADTEDSARGQPGRAPTMDYPYRRPPRNAISESVPAIRCCCGRKVGRMHVLCFKTDRDSIPRIFCMIPACWTMMLLTYGLLIGISGVVFGLFIPYLHWAVYFPAIAFLLLVLGSLSATSCGDPGVFPRYHAPKESNWRWCEKSQSFRPPGIVFCSESQVLVERIDHFCGWTGNTIARKNMCCFRIFTSTVCIQIFMCVLIAATGAVRWLGVI